MNLIKGLYGTSLSLLTDLYQLTMAYGYWKAGVADRESVFHLFFRKLPFRGGYALSCGLDRVVDYIEAFRVTADDIEYLASLAGTDGEPLFEPAFLEELGSMRLSVEVDAMAEGTLVFAHEPILRIRGPIMQCQLLETPLLNSINFQTLIATKAARICQAAGGGQVIDFGLRRAQGFDGGLSASRAAHVGGCTATSNALAGKLFGIPVKGTHAHSWVMSFDSEQAAFRAYAEAMPNNCVLLVDTYDTLEGVRRAIEVGRELRQRGHDLAGVRLDSGDLAYLSIEARKLLDAAGFDKAVIVASNDLDEHVIASLREQGAAIDLWGVGTSLVTARDQPALGGVYKLAATSGDDGEWRHTIKLSEQAIKISNPGIQQVRRYYRSGEMVADVIYDTSSERAGKIGGAVDILDGSHRWTVPVHDSYADLLQPVFRDGKRVQQPPTLAEVRAQAADQLDRLSLRTRRLLNPQLYRVGIDATLHELKMKLVARAGGEQQKGAAA